MKSLIRSTISEEEAGVILEMVGPNLPNLNANIGFSSLGNNEAVPVDLNGFGTLSPVLIKVLKDIVKTINNDDNHWRCNPKDYKLIENSLGTFLHCPHNQGYFRIESGTPGNYQHKWHVDTGDTAHMEWCNYGTSTLLSHPDSFSGALLEYCNCNKNPDAENYMKRGCCLTDTCENGETVPSELHYLSTGIHDSHLKHRVRVDLEKRKGERRTLLVFI